MHQPSTGQKSTVRMTPVYFHILLSLVDGERHGYSIMQEIDRRTDGGIRPGPGSLYWSLSRLVDTELIEEVERQGDPDQEAERRRYYQLSEMGAEVLAREAEVWARIARLAVEKNVIRDPGLA